MSSSTSATFGQTVQNAAQSVGEGVSNAAGQGAAAVAKVSDGVTRFRSAMRREPITMAFVMLAAGYMLGTLLRR